MYDDCRSECGWSDSEEQALEDIRNAAARIVDGHPAFAWPHHGWASSQLKGINRKKRAARPPSDAKDIPVVEYLYSHHKRYRILKRTKLRVYYMKEGESIDEQGTPLDSAESTSDCDNDIGFITLVKLRNGSPSSGWRYLYPSFEEILAERRRHDEFWQQQRAEYLAKHGLPPDRSDNLAALKAAMAAAHPDKGGSSAAFIEARARYVAARRACRARTEAGA
jgi:hypothetical protein